MRGRSRFQHLSRSRWRRRGPQPAPRPTASAGVLTLAKGVIANASLTICVMTRPVFAPASRHTTYHCQDLVPIINVCNQDDLMYMLLLCA